MLFSFLYSHKAFSSHRQCRQMSLKDVSETGLDYINRRAPTPSACHFTFHLSRKGRRWVVLRDSDGGSEPGTDCQPSPSLLWIKRLCQGCPRLGGGGERREAGNPITDPEGCSEPTLSQKEKSYTRGDGWRAWSMWGEVRNALISVSVLTAHSQGRV